MGPHTESSLPISKVMGAGEGAGDRAIVGAVVSVGAAVDGAIVGAAVDGSSVGAAVDGASVGAAVDGASVGAGEGAGEGAAEGAGEGAGDGEVLGLNLP